MPTTRRAFLLSTAVGLALAGPALAGDTDYIAKGPYRTATTAGVWHDAGRNRDVPWLIRYPAGLTAPAPVVIFSHGLGGNRYGAGYYGDHLASHGFIVAYVEHPGSNTDSLRGAFGGGGGGIDYEALGKRAADPMAALNRFRDIPYALDQLTAMNGGGVEGGGGPLKGYIDMARVGMSGHSYGAITTQAMAGQIYPGGSLPEQRFKAFLAMSPSGDRRGDNAAAFSGFKRPFLFLTGTLDAVKVPGTNPDPLDRQKPFQFTPASTPAVQMVFKGGDHMVFSGSELRGVRPTDARFHELICGAATAFWNAYLNGDDGALHWLRGGGLTGAAGGDAVVSVKGPDR